MNVNVLYQDEYLFICEKPVGIPSESPGLPDLVFSQTGRKAYPVHRLDQGTGGVCVLAFSSGACAKMQNLFQQGQVSKEYFAVISGKPDGTSGILEDYLFHDKRKNKSYVVKRIRSGVKKALCEWHLVCSTDHDHQTVSLIRIILHTGRTHQIRVQFGSRGLPLVGDRKYGSRIKADAPALWAGSVCFPHPFLQNSTVRAASSPPSVFPWTLFHGLT